MSDIVYLRDKVIEKDGKKYPAGGANIPYASVIVYYNKDYSECVMEVHLIPYNEIEERLGLEREDIDEMRRLHLENRIIDRQEFERLRIKEGFVL